MPDLILHGGAPKTGTSFLQVLFARYADQMAENGVLYPRGHMFDQAKAGVITSGNGVEMANYIRPWLPHDIPDKNAFIGQFGETLSGAGENHVLYSSEFLMTPPGDRISAIVDVARRYGYRIRYVYFIRDIGSALIATYSQEVKRAGEIRSLSEFIESWDPHYHNTIKQACDSFGEKNVEVYNYEEYLDGLAAFFFRNVLGTEFFPGEKHVINRSLTAKELEFQRMMNSAAPNDMRFAAFISDALMSVQTSDKTKMTLTSEEAYLLEQRFRESIEYVNRIVRGRPTVVADRTAEHRDEETISDFERSAAAILAKLVLAVAK
jgi:hypothetical protein